MNYFLKKNQNFEIKQRILGFLNLYFSITFMHSPLIQLFFKAILLDTYQPINV